MVTRSSDARRRSYSPLGTAASSRLSLGDLPAVLAIAGHATPAQAGSALRVDQLACLEIDDRRQRIASGDPDREILAGDAERLGERRFAAAGLERERQD